MSYEFKTPLLPEEYKDALSDRDLSVHEELSTTSLSQYIECMDEHEVRTSISAKSSSGIRYIDIRANEENSGDEAIIMPLPFGNGYSPAMYIRALALQSLLDKPKRILMFPNNTRDDEWYYLPPEESSDHLVNWSFQSPDKVPYDQTKDQLAKAIIFASERAGVEKAHIIGYSQGATIGAAIMSLVGGEFEVKSAMLGDAPNVSLRTLKGLKKDFQGKGSQGIKDLNKAINDSAIPALSEAQHSYPGAINLAKQMAMFAKFGLGSMNSINKRLHANMAQPTFTSDLLVADKRSESGVSSMPDARRLVVARMMASNVCTVALDISYPFNRGLKVIEGYGHEGGDNAILHALLAREAIEGRA